MHPPVPGCPGCEALQARVSELEAIAARVPELEATQARLEALIRSLQAQVVELTARLNQNSSNSSKPPSSDPPAARDCRPGPPPSGRKPGGQPGHRGFTRCRLPADEVLAYVPEACERCGREFPDGTSQGAPEPRVHQVVELPAVALHVTEHQQHACICPDCGHCTWGALPKEVPRRGEGPRLQAFCALLTGRHRLSRRQVQELLRDLFGWSPALGTLIALEAATTRALAPVVQEVETRLAAAAVLYADETSWRQQKERPTLWVLVSRHAVRFHLGRRDGATFDTLLPSDGAPVVVSDRYAVYDAVPLERRQLCWAHLARNFQALLERPGGQAVGRWAKDCIRDLFALWHRFRRAELSRAALQAELAVVQQDFRTLLRLGRAGECAQAATLCRHLEERWEALWTFADREGVEPTNNTAERALRPAVLWRKSSFGHKGEGGQRFVEAMLTVVGTLRLQEQPVLGFLEAACRAALTGGSAPSLMLEAV